MTFVFFMISLAKTAANSRGCFHLDETQPRWQQTTWLFFTHDELNPSPSKVSATPIKAFQVPVKSTTFQIKCELLDSSLNQKLKRWLGGLVWIQKEMPRKVGPK